LLSATAIALAVFLSSIILAPKAGHGAAYYSPSLGRFNSFDLVVEELDAVSQNCGIRKSAISSAIEYPLVGTGLTIHSGSPALLVVQIMSTIIFGNCVTFYNTEVTIVRSISIERDDKYSLEEIVLWSGGGMLASEQGKHASHFDDVLRQQMRDLVVSWNRSRQGRGPDQ
jgi:hypothetical protein